MTMKGANFLEKLLDGQKVEWKKLGEVCEIKNGQTINKRMIANHPGIYPVINSGKEPLGYTSLWNTENEPIGITTRGAGVGSVLWQEGRYYRGNLNYSVVIKDKSLCHVRYLYYYLTEAQSDIRSLCTFAGIPALNASQLKKLSIPLPSLSVQSRIVEILDKFTSLEAELEAELDCRKRQYIYYRELLLDFSDENKYPNVEWKKLGEVAENLDNMRRPVTGSNRVAGEYPYYGASGIVDYVDNYIFDGDYLLVSEDGANLTARKTPIAFSISGKNWVNNHAHVLKFETYVERKFVEYYLNNLDISEYVSGAAQPKLNKANLNRIPIPLLPLSEQARIVEILDKFDALTNSITEGLPLEIKLRRQQYEYYREQLLNFPHH